VIKHLPLQAFLPTKLYQQRYHSLLAPNDVPTLEEVSSLTNEIEELEKLSVQIYSAVVPFSGISQEGSITHKTAQDVRLSALEDLLKSLLDQSNVSPTEITDSVPTTLEGLTINKLSSLSREASDLKEAVSQLARAKKTISSSSDTDKDVVEENSIGDTRAEKSGQDNDENAPNSEELLNKLKSLKE
jgi:uncharacterized phage infection (PIP) family protein YhgE